MRRDSATIVALTGQIGEDMLAQVGRSLNISVARLPEVQDGSAAGQRDGRPAWETSSAALRSAAGRSSGYVLVAADPLADVAQAWQAMWQAGAPLEAAETFEQRAAEALAAWRAKRFELPDYYLVVARSLTAGQGPDWYLGPLREARPRRVALAVSDDADPSGPAAPVLATLRSLGHGPWWPPPDELIEGARRFYAGGVIPAGRLEDDLVDLLVVETQQAGDGFLAFERLLVAPDHVLVHLLADLDGPVAGLAFERAGRPQLGRPEQVGAHIAGRKVVTGAQARLVQAHRLVRLRHRLTADLHLHVHVGRNDRDRVCCRHNGANREGAAAIPGRPASIRCRRRTAY